MLKKQSLYRPDKQLEKMLLNLVYSLIAMAISVLLLFAFPHHSLLFLGLTLFLTSVTISIAIILITDSESALTYGGFANVVLDDNTVIKRIDNSYGEPVIENKPASDFFKQENILSYLKEHAFSDNSNNLNLERISQAIEKLKEESVVLELVQDEQSRFYQINIRPLYLKKNDIFESNFSIEKIQKETYLFWQIQDITAEQNMERIIEKERQKLHRFIEDMPLGLYILDENSNVEYVNDTFAAQLEMEKNQIVGKPFSDFVKNKKDKLFSSDLIDFSELTFFKNIKNQNIELFVSQNRFNDSNVLKTRGLTLKSLPNDQKLSLMFNKSSCAYKLLFNTVPVGIVYISPKLEITAYNKKAAEILEISESKSELENLFVRADLKHIDQLLASFAQSSEKQTVTTFETSLKSGKPVRVLLSPVWQTYLKESVFDGGVVYITDTTKSKSLEHQFAQAQKMQAMGQFAGGVAHDFNNLLTAMIGYCDLLLQRHRVGDPSFADINEIRQNAIRAAALVRQLLVYSKQQPTNPKYIDVVENLTDLSQFLKRVLGEQVTLEFHHDANLGFIHLDPVHFTQVIMNLSINAKDAMNGKGKLKISTHVETLLEPVQFGDGVVEAGDFIVISVTDTGCGIKKENLSRIFDPFFSTKQNVVGSGTGLGLATVYGIVSQSKGLIKVESTENVGTTFKIYFPRFEKSDEAATTPKSATQNITPVLTALSKEAPKLVFGLNVTKTDHQGKSKTNPSQIKILFVEDENSVRAFGVRALKKKGFNVVSCSSGENALEQKGPFDLMVTDMVMPGISGTELASQMKKRQSDIKIIIASGYSEEMARKELSGDESFTFLAKPYSLGDLTQKVFEVLNGSDK